MNEPDADWRVLVKRAQDAAACELQPHELVAIDAAIEFELDHGVRGSLLLARSVARQGDADITLALADSVSAYELLTSSGRLDETALAAAITGLMYQRAGDTERCIDHAIEAMVLLDTADRTPTAARAANALAILFAQLSAFEQAMTFTNLASDISGDEGCKAGFAIPYTRCYISVEAHHAGVAVPLAPAHVSLQQLLESDNPAARTMLGPGMAAELTHLEHPETDTRGGLDEQALDGSAPRLAAWFKLVMADSQRRHGTNETAERLLDDALPVLINIGDDHRVARALRLRSNVRNALGNMQGALEDAAAMGDTVRGWHVQQVGRLAVQLSQRADLEKQRSALRRKAADNADVDTLTQTASREALERRLDELSLQHGTAAVAVVDVDRSASMNELHGTTVRDDVLRQLGEILLAMGIGCDVLARTGDDEFVAVFTRGGESVASAFAAAVRARMAEFDWEDLAPGLDVRVSAGIAQGGFGQIRSVIEQAESALSTAKRLGRDRSVTALDSGWAQSHCPATLTTTLIAPAARSAAVAKASTA